jgi:hypothetical protein
MKGNGLDSLVSGSGSFPGFCELVMNSRIL